MFLIIIIGVYIFIILFGFFRESSWCGIIEDEMTANRYPFAAIFYFNRFILNPSPTNKQNMAHQSKQP